MEDSRVVFKRSQLLVRHVADRHDHIRALPDLFDRPGPCRTQVEASSGGRLHRLGSDPFDRPLRLYATGEYSLPDLQTTMHAKGLTSPYARRPGAPVSVSKLAELLTNPFYLGVVQWGDSHYEGQHKALIPQILFDRVQETLRARDVAGVRQRRHEHYLKGLLHCGECGRRLSLTLAKGRYLYFYCLGQRGSARTGCRQPYILADDAEALVEDLYRRIQLPRSWVRRLTEELEAEIVERQAEASERRVLLTKTLAKLAEERGKLMQAFYANAIPLDLLKAEQDCIGAAEQGAKVELETTEGDLDGWQEVLRTAIRLAGNCHAAYLKAWPSVRRRFNDAVLHAVYIKDRRIGRTEFSEVFAPLFSRPSSNKTLKVVLIERCANHPEAVVRARPIPVG